MDIKTPYYEDMSRISNSNIGWFLKKGPRYLKDMLDGLVEGLKGSFLDKGTMIHEYILQPEEFWNDYVILDFEVPTRQQKDFCIVYAQSAIFDPDERKLDSYRQAYNNSKSDKVVIAEADKIIDSYKGYIDFLENGDKTKTTISFADLTMLKTIKQNMQDHKKANELLFDFAKTFEVHNEFHINWEFPNASSMGDFPCKSLLDRVMIDHTNKKIILVDIKTTADIYNFRHSIEEFSYKRQLSYYWMALHWYFARELKLNTEDYEFETYIIAVQSHDGYEVKVFKFTPESVESQVDIISTAIKEIAWHKDNNKWDHIRSYYECDGTEDIE